MSRKKILKSMLLVFLLCIGVGKVISYFNLFLFVPTSSMSPTIEKRTLVTAKRLIDKEKEEIKQGDIVVFEAPEGIAIKIKGREFENFNMVKRVIAVGGDRVRIEQGVVYVNGLPIQEPYVRNIDSYNMKEIKVPLGEIFLMGDNRADSFDSRYCTNQTLNVDNVIGKITSVK